MTTAPKSTPPVRQRDPTARRLLAVLLDLERAPWPAARSAYAAALLAFATRCERTDARADMYRWAVAEFAGYLQHRNAQVRECRIDALADLSTELPGTLLRFRAGLDDSKRPHLTSMLRAAFLWRSTDLLESLHLRHTRRTMPELRDDDRPTPGGPGTVTMAREVLALLDPADPHAHGLLRVAAGDSIAEAARRTGLSRQQIYRARARLKALIDATDLANADNTTDPTGP